MVSIMVAALYAGVLTFVYVALSLRVIGARRSAAIALGNGGVSALLRRTRVHANFAEYVPLALILMTLLELQEAPPWTLHAFGISLVAGRLIHAYGLSQDPETLSWRVIGMTITFTVLISGAMANIALAL